MKAFAPGIPKPYQPAGSHGFSLMFGYFRLHGMRCGLVVRNPPVPCPSSKFSVSKLKCFRAQARMFSARRQAEQRASPGGSPSGPQPMDTGTPPAPPPAPSGPLQIPPEQVEAVLRAGLLVSPEQHDFL